MRMLHLVDFYNKLRAAGLPDVLSKVGSKFIFYADPNESVQTALTGTITGIVLQYVEINEKVTKEEFQEDKFFFFLKELSKDFEPKDFDLTTRTQIDSKKELPVAKFHLGIQAPDFNPSVRQRFGMAEPQEITLRIYLSDEGKLSVLPELYYQQKTGSATGKIKGTFELLSDFLGVAQKRTKDVPNEANQNLSEQL